MKQCDHPHIEDLGEKWTFCEDDGCGRNHQDACGICTTWCYLTPLGWYCVYHGFVINVYDPT